MTTIRRAVRWIAPISLCLQFLSLHSDAFTSSVSRFETTPTAFRSPATTRLGALSPSSDDENDDVCTVQILMSATGGGHLASAIALEDALENLHPGKFQCDIVDIYTDYGPFWPYNDYVGMYKLMAEFPWTWDLFFRFGETEFGLALNQWMLDTFCYENFTKCIGRKFRSTAKRADMVVSVHPLCQDLPLKILSDLDASDDDREDKTPFVTVVTDLGGAHKTWFHPAVDKCFVPSDALNQKAQSRGLNKSSQIVQYGLPIRKGFWPKENNSEADDDRNTVRANLGIDDIPTVLVVGGGDGMGGIVDIASALGKKLGSSSSNNNNDKPEYQMVVVCGNNQEAQQKLNAVDWPKGVRVNVQGFVRNMDEWMKASDCLVTKAGPGTIAEASICGLPCMLFAYLPGQEEGNIPFVEDSGFGRYSSDPDEIGSTVTSWLKSPEKLESMKRAALSASRPFATIDIARDLAEIAFSTKKKQQRVQQTRDEEEEELLLAEIALSTKADAFPNRSMNRTQTMRNI